METISGISFYFKTIYTNWLTMIAHHKGTKQSKSGFSMNSMKMTLSDLKTWIPLSYQRFEQLARRQHRATLFLCQWSVTWMLISAKILEMSLWLSPKWVSCFVPSHRIQIQFGFQIFYGITSNLSANSTAQTQDEEINQFYFYEVSYAICQEGSCFNRDYEN